MTIEAHLGGEDHTVAAAADGQPFTEQGFAFVSGSCPVGVIVRGVDEVSSGIKIGIKHGKGVLAGSGGAEIHRAQRRRRDGETVG